MDTHNLILLSSLYDAIERPLVLYGCLRHTALAVSIESPANLLLKSSAREGQPIR